MHCTRNNGPYTQKSGRGIYVYTIECPSPAPLACVYACTRVRDVYVCVCAHDVYVCDVYVCMTCTCGSNACPGRALGVCLEGLVMHWLLPLHTPPHGMPCIVYLGPGRGVLTDHYRRGKLNLDVSQDDRF